MTKQHHTPALPLNKTKTGKLKANKIQTRRFLKVRESYHSYQLQQPCKQRVSVAEIHLKGHWLITAGFAIDTPLTVQVKQGFITITPEIETGKIKTGE